MSLLQDLILQYHPSVEVYKQAYELSTSMDLPEYHLKLDFLRATDRRRHNALSGISELAGIVPGDVERSPPRLVILHFPLLSPTGQTIFSFRTGPTTVLASLFYLAVFVSLYTTQSGPRVPSVDRQHTLDLSVDQAYRDLHLVAERPHPYNSRQNDVVRRFLLQRLQDVAKGHDFVHVDDDIRTNAAFLDGSRAVYVQGNNLLVKIDGTDNATEGDGVLFSAHFDSVSTAPGATDNGMGVVALLQLVNLLCKNRPRRTAVFNINNGEEDGLHGAHTFLRHPWSDLTSTFLNVEGGGSGGRPILLRTTSYDVLKAFRSAPHIHADAISQDAWDQHIIRSDTDYSVYSAPRTWGVSSLAQTNVTIRGYVDRGGGMQGADIAFYTGRSRYHTMDETIRGMGDGGAQKSLWSLLELLHSVSDSILNGRSDPISNSEHDKAVYFELFGVYLVAFPFHVLLVAEIILLIVGPILLASLGYVLVRQSILSPPFPARTQSGSDFRGYGRFWFALVLGAGAQAGLVVGFLKINPNTAHSHPVATSLSAFSLAYLSLAIPLQLAQRLRPIPPSRQRSIILVELYGLTWVFLATITFLTQVAIAGLYWIALWNASLLVAVVLGAFEGLWGTRKAGKMDLPRDECDGENPHPRGRRRQRDESETSETTPLLRRISPSTSLVLDETAQDKAYFWWIFQFMISTTAPVVNLATIFTIWVGAMFQTIPDGGRAGIGASCFAFALFPRPSPTGTFCAQDASRAHLVILLVFISSTAYAWIATPFTSNSRLRVFFAHRVELTNMSVTPGPQLIRAVTRLDLIEGYGPRLAATLPSSQYYGDDPCEGYRTDGFGSVCEWAVPPVLQPSIPGEKEGSWLIANVTRRGPASLRVEIEGVQTRVCRIYVDSHSIQRYRARTIGNPQMEWSAFDIPASKERDIHLLTLWARSWETKKFQADLELDAGNEEGEEVPIVGRVSCLWNDGPGGALIPALDEARAFLPEWVAITNTASGLVEASSRFVL
ncbi:hypothetical protein EDB83DRAFT_2528347 [Lactarius deliciosus]|nr:hypothetical protein EDB83DRAFT_2528347 [Lactarius deliciosus]